MQNGPRTPVARSILYLFCSELTVEHDGSGQKLELIYSVRVFESEPTSTQTIELMLAKTNNAIGVKVVRVLGVHGHLQSLLSICYLVSFCFRLIFCYLIKHTYLLSRPIEYL